MAETQVCQFVATIPSKASAIAFDGGEDEGGRLVLDVPGTHAVELLKLLQVRGCWLHVTVTVDPEEDA